MAWRIVGGLTAGDDTRTVTGDGPELLLRFYADGRDGNDVITIATTRVGGSADVLFGRGGDDRLSAGANNDLLFGGAGSDLLLGGAGDDRLHGGADGDDLRSGGGIDILAGEGGDDVLAASGGMATLEGGDGSDRFIVRAGVDVVRIVDLDLDASEGDLALAGIDTLQLEGSLSWSGTPDDPEVDTATELTDRLAGFAEEGRVAGVVTGTAGDGDEELWVLLGDGPASDERLIRLEGWAAKLETGTADSPLVSIPGAELDLPLDGDPLAVLRGWVDAGLLDTATLDSWVARGFVDA